MHAIQLRLHLKGKTSDLNKNIISESRYTTSRRVQIERTWNRHYWNLSERFDKWIRQRLGVNALHLHRDASASCERYGLNFWSSSCTPEANGRATPKIAPGSVQGCPDDEFRRNATKDALFQMRQLFNSLYFTLWIRIYIYSLWFCRCY